MSEYPEMVDGVFGQIPFKFEKIDPDDDHMTIEEWKEACDDGMFIDYDGWGDFATETECSNLSVSPSDYYKNPDWNPPSWATHIVWYNR